MKNHLIATVMAVVSLVSGTGCAPDDPEEEQTTSNEVASSEGQLAVRLVGADDVVGFTVEVFDDTGVSRNRRYVALEGEGLDPGLVEPLDVGVLSDEHRFSDAFFVLPPGNYKVQATPMSGPNLASRFCSRAVGNGVVREGMTVEILLVISCRAQPNGALDVVTLLNHPPVIRDLQYAASKFARTCECTTITVAADDSDGDEVQYTWAVVGKPSGALFDASPAGNSFRFTARTPGTYQVKVTACDRALRPLCTSLTFPIHVSGLASSCT